MTKSLKRIAWSVFETADPFEFDELTCFDFPFEEALLGGIESLKEEYVLALENCAIIRAILAQIIVEELTSGSVHESWIEAMAADFNEGKIKKPRLKERTRKRRMTERNEVLPFDHLKILLEKFKKNRESNQLPKISD